LPRDGVDLGAGDGGKKGALSFIMNEWILSRATPCIVDSVGVPANKETLPKVDS
jgi:hypothetical protein